MKSALGSPEVVSLKRTCDERLLMNGVAFNFNLRPYIAARQLFVSVQPGERHRRYHVHE
jgi:hypothetical protein